MNDLPPQPLPAARVKSRHWVVPAVLVVALLVAGGGWWYWKSQEEAPAPVAAKDGKDGKGGAPGKGGGPGKGQGGRFGFDPNRVQPVAAVPARKGDIRVVQTGLGTVTASRTVIVRPRIEGPLLKVHFKEGQDVRFGEVLAEIDPAQVLVSLAQAEGTLAREQAVLANARVDLERYRTLLAQDSIARQQVDSQAALVQQFEGTVKVNRALVDNAKLQLSYTKVVAPIAGRLGLRSVDPGNIVRQSDANGLVTITQVDPISVLFTIPQDVLPRVLKELKGNRMPVEAWDRDLKNKLVDGWLITTDNQVDVATGTVRLKAEFPNTDQKLFPNQFVNVRLVVDVLKDKTLIPSSAIQRGPQGAVVFVVKEDNTVGMRPVVLGPQEGITIAVEGGVQPGERVVTDGIDRLREGAKVEIVQPQAGQPGGGRGGGGGGRGPRGEGGKRGEGGAGPAAPQPGTTPGGPTTPPGGPVPAPGAPAGTPAKVTPLDGMPRTGPTPSAIFPDARKEAPAAAPGATSAPPAKGAPAGAGAKAESMEDFRKRMQSLPPEERREHFRKRMEGMTPEEREKAREEFRKRREASGG